MIKAGLKVDIYLTSASWITDVCQVVQTATKPVYTSEMFDYSQHVFCTFYLHL